MFTHWGIHWRSFQIFLPSTTDTPRDALKYKRFYIFSGWISNVRNLSLHSVHTSIPAKCLSFVFTSERLPWRISRVPVIHILVMLAIFSFIILTQTLIWKNVWESGMSSERKGSSCVLSSRLLVSATFMHMPAITEARYRATEVAYVFSLKHIWLVPLFDMPPNCKFCTRLYSLWNLTEGLEGHGFCKFHLQYHTKI